MLDLATLVALALGLYASVRRRFILGVLVAVGIAVATCVMPIVALRGRIASGEFAATMLFVGPSGLMSKLLTRELSQIALAAVAFGVAARRAGRLRPECVDARAWDATSRPFLAVAVIRSLIAVSAASIAYLLERTTF